MGNSSADSGPVGAHAPEAPKPLVPRWALHRRLYDWVLGFAHHRHAGTALGVLSFSESSFFPIPPDVLLAPLCLGNRRRSFFFAALTTGTSVLGAYLGYAIGLGAIGLVAHLPGVEMEAVKELAAKFNRHGGTYVFVAALSPIPFKILTIAAGAAHMPLLPFTLACLVGRGLRFFAVAGLVYAVGPRAMPLIDRHFNTACLLAALLLALLVLAMKGL
jgi:membrane protein YqaA with SNARE-associated domain